MNRVLCFLILVSVPSFLFASASIGESDFIKRSINFVIFIAILWYFAFDTVKGIFVRRKESISTRLKDAQDNLHKAKQEKELMQKRLDESKVKAKEIVSAARQEAYLLEQKYNDLIKKDTEALKYVLESNVEFERRKAIQDSVNDILDTLLSSNDVHLNQEEYVNILTKRIS